MEAGRRRATGRVVRAVLSALGLAVVMAGMVSIVAVPPVAAASYVPVSGAGSTWSQNAIDQWRRDVEQYGM
jgi:hypothetical protein